jgi:hypothetical protein
MSYPSGYRATPIHSPITASSNFYDFQGSKSEAKEDAPYTPYNNSTMSGGFMLPHINVAAGGVGQPNYMAPPSGRPGMSDGMHAMPLTASSRPATRGDRPMSSPGLKPGASMYAETVVNKSVYSDGGVSAEPSFHFGSSYGLLNGSAMSQPAASGESVRLKAEQLRMLQDQNAHLLGNYEQLEFKANGMVSRNEELEGMVCSFSAVVILWHLCNNHLLAIAGSHIENAIGGTHNPAADRYVRKATHAH